MNRYTATYNLPSGTTIVATPYSITAESMEDAVRYMTSDKGAEPYSMALAELDARVVDTTSKVTFTTTISPTAAQTAGAVALPTTFSVIPTTVVIFQAVEATGYSFVKWTKNGVDAGTDLRQEIGITADDTEIVAVFEAA